jgi:hypothetical protein
MAEQRPEINARITLRTYARATDLPLIPGKFGPAIYVAFNLVLLFLAYWLNRPTP